MVRYTVETLIEYGVGRVGESRVIQGLCLDTMYKDIRKESLYRSHRWIWTNCWWFTPFEGQDLDLRYDAWRCWALEHQYIILVSCPLVQGMPGICVFQHTPSFHCTSIWTISTLNGWPTVRNKLLLPGLCWDPSCLFIDTLQCVLEDLRPVYACFGSRSWCLNIEWRYGIILFDVTSACSIGPKLHAESNLQNTGGSSSSAKKGTVDVHRGGTCE